MIPFERIGPVLPDRIDTDSKFLQHFLGGLEAFGRISKVRLTCLAEGARVSRLPRRTDTLFRGLFAADVHMVIQGAAKIAFLDRNGRALLTTVVGAGGLFGGCTLLLPRVVEAFRCVCLRDCVFARFHTEELVDALLGASLAELARLQLTITRLGDQVMRYSGRADSGLRERLATALLDLATRFGAPDSRGTLLTLLVTHDMLADLIGASRQRITVTVNELIRCGAVKRDGRRLILLITELQKIGQIAPDDPSGRPSGADEEEDKLGREYRNGVYPLSPRRGYFPNGTVSSKQSAVG